MSAFRETATQIAAGNIAALTGLDLARAGETLVDSKYKDVIIPFESMKYVSEPVMTVAIEPKNPEDLPSLSEAMKRLAIEDPNLTISINEKTGEYLLSGIGELHLETAIKFLEDYSGGTDVTTSNPTVDYRETITGKGLTVIAKSPNKQNSFWVQVEPLEDKRFELEVKNEGERVWVVDENRNMLINSTKAIQYLAQVKDMVIQGFRWACKTGPLCEQPLRGIKVKLVNAQISENSTLREPKQITRAISRAILGSFLTAKPILLEPIYKIEVKTPIRWFGTSANIITSRRGRVQATENRSMLTIITGYVPVAETFGLSAEMRSSTSGHTFWQSTFDHWGQVPENLAVNIIKQIRKRRGLPPEIPKPDKFTDENESEAA
jgi:elongation factor 2